MKVSPRLRAVVRLCREVRLLALLAVTLFLVAASPAAAAMSPIPDVSIETNGQVKALAQSGGRTFLGGSFSRAGVKTPYGLDVNATTGAPGSTFAVPNAPVVQAIADGAGGWYVTGNFSALGAVAVNGLAHLRSDGSVDPSFLPVISTGSVTALLLSADGLTLYVGGTFTSAGGQGRNRVAAFSTATGAVLAFNPNFDGAVNALALSGSTLYVGGGYSKVNGSTSRARVAAVSTATGTATSFNPTVAARTDGTNTAAVNVILVNGSTVYIGGTFATVNSPAVSRPRLAAVDATTGALIPAFDAHLSDALFDPPTDTGPAGSVDALVLSAGTLYIGGTFSSVGSPTVTRNNIAALNATTGLPTAFDPNVDQHVGTLSLSGTTLYAGGFFSTVNGTTSRNRAAAFDTTTGTATAFNPNLDSTVSTLPVAGGRAYLGGGFSFAGSSTVRSDLAAVLPDGSLDPSFDANVNGPGAQTINALAVSGGTLYAGGAFATVNGTTTRANLAAFDAAGTGTATSFDPSTNNAVFALAASATTLYAGGSFTAVNVTAGNPAGTPRSRIAAFETGSGGVASSFDPSVSAAVGASVNALALSSGALYAGGTFTMVNGATARNRVASFDTATGTATAFDPNANNTVNALVVGPDTVYAGGLFTTVGGAAHLRLAAVDATTGAARPAFDQGAGSTVSALALRGGTLFAGGQFTTITNPGITRDHLAALDATTGALGAFDPDISNNVVALLSAGTHLYVGGGFSTVGGLPRANFARFTDPVVAPVAVTGAASSVTSTGASLAGTINPGGAPVTYTFEYGPSTSFGFNGGFASAGAGTSDVPVAATLSGLTSDTTYYYRAVAKDASGTSYFGSVSTFDTGPGGAPIVATGAASAVTNTGATLSGTVDPHGKQTAFTFEYGTSFAASGTTLISAVDNEDAGNGPRTVSLPISGLAPDTTYFYRLVATNGSGTAMGAVTSFTTGPGGAPIVTTGAASAITASGATLAGTVNAHGAQTSYTFEYGTTTAFGSITTVAGAGSSNGVASVSLPVSGLAAGTTYLYRLVATNANGTTAGAVQFLTTSGGA